MDQGLSMKVLTCWEKIQLFAESKESEAAIFAGGKREFALRDIINMYHSSLHVANIRTINIERPTTALAALLKIYSSLYWFSHYGYHVGGDLVSGPKSKMVILYKTKFLTPGRLPIRFFY